MTVISSATLARQDPEPPEQPRGEPEKSSNRKTDRIIYDWDAIERDYNANLLSLRQLARAHGVKSENSIRMRAKAEGWTRDLGPKIRTAVAAKLDHDEAGGRSRSEKEFVQLAVEMRVDIGRTQRSRIKRLTAILDSYVEKLEQLKANEIIDLPSAKLAMDVMDKTVGAAAKLTLLERQAYSMDEPAAQTAASATDDLMKRLNEMAAKHG